MKSKINTLLVFALGALYMTACKSDDDAIVSPVGVPELSTRAVTEITPISAVSGGMIINDGGAQVTSRGVVWNTEQVPSIENHLGLTEDEEGVDEFTSILSGLNGGLTYYLRAYASNAGGTGYGQEIAFSTTEPLAEGTYATNAVHCQEEITAVVDVLNPETGRTWMDRNLGASQLATSYNDEAAYGDLYQWGRFSDGHQCRSSSTTSAISSGDTPGHNQFITTTDLFHPDWRNPHNNDLWDGLYGINNPCPGGYRLPTQAEFNEERNTWSSANTAGAFASTLRLTMAGYRYNNNGVFSSVGFYGYYWSSTISTDYAQYLNLTHSVAAVSYHHRSNGYSVRCIKD